MLDLINFRHAEATDYGLKGSEVDFPVTTVPVGAIGSSGKTIEIPNFKAVVRADRDNYENVQPLGVVGDKYKVLKHTDFFGTIEETIHQAVRPDLRQNIEVKTETSFNGAWARRDYVFPDIGAKLKNSEFETQFGFRLIAWNSYDGSSSAGLITGLIDFYCTNGMITGHITDKLLRRHTSGLTSDTFSPMIETNVGDIQEQVRFVEKMMHTSITEDEVDAVLEFGFSERRGEALKARYEIEAMTRGANVFALQSAMTYYSSHNSDEFKVRDTGRDNEARTLHNREAEVQRVVQADIFQQLLAA